MSWVDIGLLSGTEIGADFALKMYTEDTDIKWLGAGVVGYAGVIYFLIKALNGTPVMIVNSAWDGMSNIVETLAAMVILGERADPQQYVGMALIACGLFLLKLPITKE